MLERTRNVLALGTTVTVCAVAGSLAGAPTASACAIYPDGNCINYRAKANTSVQPVKPKYATLTAVAIRRSH